MNSITKTYLTDIICRVINQDINVYRKSHKSDIDQQYYPTATDEEILDFIHSIPYFDEKLKDFLVGNLCEETIIISQNWEIEFLKKTMLWAESIEWLYGNKHFLKDPLLYNINRKMSFLTLPY